MSSQVANIHKNQTTSSAFDFFNTGTFKTDWQGSSGAQKAARVFLAIGLGFPGIGLFTASGMIFSKARKGTLTKKDVGYAAAIAIPLFGPLITAAVVGPKQIRCAIMGAPKTVAISIATECPEHEETAPLIAIRNEKEAKIKKRPAPLALNQHLLGNSSGLRGSF